MSGTQKRPQAFNAADVYLKDKPSNFNHPYIKIAFNFIAVLLLGANFDALTSSYFTSVLMFSSPMVLQYLEFTPVETLRKLVRRVQLVVLILTCCICIMGLIGILYIEVRGGSPQIIVHASYAAFGDAGFSAGWLLGLVWAAFILNCIAPFSTATVLEENINGYSVATIKRRK